MDWLLVGFVEKQPLAPRGLAFGWFYINVASQGITKVNSLVVKGSPPAAD